MNCQRPGTGIIGAQSETAALPITTYAMPRQFLGLRMKLRRRLAILLESMVIRPGPLIKLLNLLRKYWPIVVIQQFAIVTRYDDVREVLKSEDFQVDYYKAGPDQIVAMNDCCEHQRDVSQLRGARCRELASVREVVRTHAESLISTACGRGTLDLVEDYSRPLTLALIYRLLGLQNAGEPLMEWTRAIFRHVFANFTDDPLIAEQASHSRSRMDTFIDRQVAAVAARSVTIGDSEPHGMLYTLLQEGDGRQAHGRPESSSAEQKRRQQKVRNFVGGLACATSETVSTAIACSVDYLLDHKDILESARELAHGSDFQAGEADGSSFDRLTHHVFEILRFRPEIPFLPRISMRNIIVAKGTSRAKLIPGNSLVLAAVASAMFDPEKFPDPYGFNPHRCLNDYLHFGLGLHECLGKPVAMKAVPEALAALLRLKQLQRVRGRAGRLRFDGALPTNMLVEVAK